MSATSENNLSGKLGLDTTDFKTGVTELKNQVKNIETSFRAAAVSMEDWGSTSNGLKERVNSLREEISKQKQEMEIYRQELQKVSSGSEADQKAADSLTNKMYSLQKQIGYNEKDFQKYSEQLVSVEKSEKENSSSTGKLGQSFMEMAEKSRQSTSKIKEHFSNLKSSITGYIAGIVSAVSLKEVIEDTDAAEKNLSQMDAALKSTGDASGMTKEQLVELAEAQSKVTTYSAETTEKAENMLLTFTNLKSNVFPQAIQATEDMATAMHMDATSAAQQLGKALNDPATGYSKLQRIGVTFTSSQVSTIKAMEKAGNTAGAQKIILQELEKEYGSSAKAAGSTLTGQIQIMQNNVKSAGVQITSSLLPIATNIMPSVVKGIQGLADQIMSRKGEIVAAFTAISNGAKAAFGWAESHGALVKNAVIGIAAAVGAWKTALLAANVVQAVNNAVTVTSAISAGGLAAGEEALSAAKGSTTLATMALSAATIKDTVVKVAHAVATKASTAAQTLFNAALNANPIGIVITLIAALIAALVVLFNKNKGFHDWVMNAFSAIKSTAQAVGSWFSGPFVQFFQTAGNGIKSFFAGIPGFFSGLWNTVKSEAAAGASGAKNAAVGAFDGLKSGTTAIMSNVRSAFTAAWNGIKNTVTTVISGIVNFITAKFSAQIASIKIIFADIQRIFTAAWEIIKNIVLGAVLLIIDLVTGNFTKLKEDAAAIFDSLAMYFQDIWDNISDIFTRVIGIITLTLAQAWSAITTGITTAWGAITTFFAATWTAISTGVRAFWNALPGFFTNLWTVIRNGITNAWNAVLQFFAQLWVNIGNGVRNAWNGFWTTINNLNYTIKTGVISVWNSVLAWFRNLPGTLRTIGSNMFTSMKNGVNSTINNVTSAIKTGIGAAISWIKALPGEAVQWGKDLINGIVQGIKDAADAVGDAVKGVAQNIRKFLHFSVPDEGPLVDFASWMPDMMTGLARGIEANKYKVIAAMQGLAADMSIAPAVRPAYAGAYSAPAAAASSGSTIINYTTNINSPAAPTPSSVNRVERQSAQRIALMMRRNRK